jgi:hypothetical protein
MQVVGIGKLHLASDIFQIFRAKRAFDGTLGAHIHKNRGLNRAVGAGKYASAGFALCFLQFKHKLPHVFNDVFIVPEFKRLSTLL